MNPQTTYVDELAQAIRSSTPADLIPDGANVDDLFRLYALLGLVKGQAVGATDVHDAWSTWMVSRGKDHESLVPFSELPPEVQAEDEPFAAAIRKACPR